MKDTFRHKGLRQILVDKIRKKGISNESVLNMINEIPRHLFLDNAFVQFAYQDKPFPIGAGQTISQPYTVAFQTQLLELNPYEKVLEVGTGSGYQAAVLIGMEANVYTIERQKELFQKTKEFLPELGYNCNFYYGDGYKGLEQFAPFDKIIVTCGAPAIPEDLIKQLKIGGRMVAPIGKDNVQVMNLIEKTSETETKITTHGEFSFVPMLNDKTNGN
ncbi:MAG: protein-L-isoaspartate(D-aspartate) O-methyltransferase [Flavobacteriales bacterium]|jgi:protein-L-isoaspartate(D-aspartate) O-methyltransferase|nr:protein-L-isoaspartate(D-aspartate) O-methyltransferase [Flavobacteriales bacterium]MBT6699207.1 protein-L-isoaspartate(D-aspartate) O-methyltransferase [Flavobacteriales bacterium]MBT7619806.1 protein-L-isoaspartate(D-aspartate) O-methyltransferase [Flavobacteriales bacterium]MBT7725981.1 protein-L-isoaspartate(D-aspartate) O-methyltransferase [Flavobacteriales bacterium]